MKALALVGLLVLLLCALAGCAAGPNGSLNTAGPSGGVAGFGWGLWHGVISPVTFIVSLFNKSVTVYDVHNDGGWYNFGFLLGVIVIFGGSGGGAARRRR
jgi:hypothetical protein